MDRYQENRLHGTPAAPWAVYDCTMPRDMHAVPAHWHEEFELILVRAGSALYRCGSREFSSRAGDLVCIPPRLMHSIRLQGDQAEHHVALVFHGELLGASNQDRAAKTLLKPLMTGALSAPVQLSATHASYPSLEPVLQALFSGVRANTAVDDLIIKSSLLNLFWQLCRQGLIGQTAIDQAMEPDTQRILDTVCRMNREFLSPLTLRQLAGWTGMAESHFCRRFKACIGVSPMDHILDLRIQAACGMLRTTRLAVLEVATRAGFNNLSNFNRQFRKRTGMSPRAWRFAAQ